MNAKLGCAIAGCALLAGALVFTFGPQAGLRETTADHANAKSAAATAATPDVSQLEAGPATPQHREQLTIAATAADVAEHSRRLRIVDESGAPLPGAEYFDGELPSPSMGGLLVCEAMREQWHPDAWLATHCERQVADSDGFVDGHDRGRLKLNVARLGARIAFWDRDPDVLAFGPERTCRVTVVDHTGRPVAGAMVTLRCERIVGLMDEHGEYIVGTTDEHGECIVTHLQRLKPHVRQDARQERFGVRGIGLQSADVWFDAASPPAAVTLTVPPCGRVAIELVDAGGTRLAVQYPITLIGPDDDELEEYTRPSGPIDFGLCACGVQLAVNRPDGVRFAGPHAASERVTQTLHLTDLRPGGYVLTGRAVASDLTPLAKCELRGQRTTTRFPGQWSTVTSATGRFTIELDDDQGEVQLGDYGFGILEFAKGTRGSPVVRRGTYVDLRERLTPGIIELGDVVLVDPVVVARGRVRDAAGAAVEPSMQAEWRRQGTEVIQNASGRFEVRALGNNGPLTVRCSADGYADRDVTVQLPCDDLDIVMAPIGRFRVLVEVDAELCQHTDAMLVEFVDATGTRMRAMPESCNEGWLCEVTTAPGTYRCEVRPFQSTQVLASAPGLVVLKGSDGGEPTRIDLRGKLRTMELRWRSAAGEKLDQSEWDIHVAAPPPDHGDERRWDNIGPTAKCSLLLVGTGEPLSLMLESTAGHCVTWSGSFGDASVTVPPAARIPFRIVELPRAPDDGEWGIHAWATAGDGKIRLYSGYRLEKRALGSVYSMVDAAGRGSMSLLPQTRYAFELRLTLSDRWPRVTRIVTTIPREVVIGATLPAELEFRFDTHEMQAAFR